MHDNPPRKLDFDTIISVESLFRAWAQFRRGKRRRYDIQKFEWYLEPQLIGLHEALSTQRYTHGGYQAFRVKDPKERLIHKAAIRDRLVHQALYSALLPHFERQFIDHSYASRKGKGTHEAIIAYQRFSRQITQNFRQNASVLNCDIWHFFHEVDHDMLMTIIKRRITDRRTLELIEIIVDSFEMSGNRKGIPLGNLTSQLFCNIYLNELDQYVKHRLKLSYYLRYMDDCIVLSNDAKKLTQTLKHIEEFLNDTLRLKVHPKKRRIMKIQSGVDILGTIVFPKHQLLRSSSVRRMTKQLQKRVLDTLNGGCDLEDCDSTLQSYLGMTAHVSGDKVRNRLLQLSGLMH